MERKYPTFEQWFCNRYFAEYNTRQREILLSRLNKASIQAHAPDYVKWLERQKAIDNLKDAIFAPLKPVVEWIEKALSWIK